jgi:acid phosphatase (class A)
MAAHDAVVSAPALSDDFACALGVKLDQGNAPVLTQILTRMLVDERKVVDPPKDRWARRRPYLSMRGDICVERNDLLDKSGSYPSGHSTLGWSWALILAELAPDRATAILKRGRTYGESRVVCGVHYPSDVDQGRTNGAALVAALHGSSEFRADMDRARAEIEAARKSGGAVKPDPGQCGIEQAAEARRPW